MISQKGFVLVETVMVSVAVLTIFTIMYVNFYPLIGEYEKREVYDDIDSKYIAHWVRKLITEKRNTLNDYDTFYLDDCGGSCKIIYSSYKDDDGNNQIIQNKINKIFEYQNNTTVDYSSILYNLIEVSNIKAIIITSYNLQNFKNYTASLVNNNTNISKHLFNSGFNDYIAYLPVYKTPSKSPHGAEYRVIVVMDNEYSKEYDSYATIELSNYVTPVSTAQAGICDAQGKTTYINGQYRYTKIENGWKMELIDKNSTAPIKTQMCKRIDGFPVTDMTSLFENSKTTEIDLSSFDTANVTNMQAMFAGCENITTLDLSSLDTSNVTNMQAMFNGCKNMINIDISDFDTSHVTNMIAMFSNCSKLKKINFTNINTANVTNMSDMFANCSLLDNIDFSKFNTENVVTMERMFYMTGFKTLDISAFNTTNVTNMKYMFSLASNLKTIKLSNSFVTDKVTTMEGMFVKNKKLETLDFKNFNTTNVVSMAGMFSGCESFTNLDLSSFATPNLTKLTYNANGLYGIFEQMSSLKTLDIRNFDFSKVTNPNEYAIILKGSDALQKIIVKDEQAKSFITARLNDINKTDTSVEIAE